MELLKNIIKKEYSFYFFALLLVIFLSYLNYPGFYRVFNSYRDDSFSIIYYILPIFLGQTLILVALSLFLSRIWACILIFLTATSNYAVHAFGIEIGAGIIQAMMQTNLKETLEAVSFLALTQFTLLNATIPMLVTIFIKLKPVNLLKRLTIFGHISFVAILLWATPYLINKEQSQYAFKNYVNNLLAPTDVLTGIVQYKKLYADALKILPPEQIIRTEEIYKFSKPPMYKEPVVFVLVIGESHRSDHLSLNGYERKTTPFLDKEEDLISYKQALSCYTLTMYSVPCIMSPKSMKNFALPVNHSSVISVLKSLGFETHWISNHIDTGVFNCHETDNCMLYEDIYMKYKDTDKFTEHDEMLLSPVKEALIKNPEKNKLIIINTIASHVHYNLRYPQTEEFLKYKPICEKFIHDCKSPRIINSYDNSLRYTDWVLGQLLDILRDKNAALIYTSDHGESLGENKVFLHSFHETEEDTPIEQKHVPMVFWSSKNFYDYNRIKKPLFIEKQNENKNVRHENVFHSILDCLGVKSEAINREKSFCYLGE